MSSAPESVKVAVIQGAPLPFDLEGTVEKVISSTLAAGEQGAKLVLLRRRTWAGIPGVWPSGPPWVAEAPPAGEPGSGIGPPPSTFPGPRRNVSDKPPGKRMLIWPWGWLSGTVPTAAERSICTLLYFGPDGTLLGKHRKLKPTAAERVIWGEGDGSTLPVMSTPFGRVGGLICWENYMPLARMTMYGKGVDIYLAPTADARDRWQSTLQHIALEGRCFVLGCNQYMTRDMYPEDLEIKEELEAWPETLCRGGSAIYSPLGDWWLGPSGTRRGFSLPTWTWVKSPGASSTSMPRATTPGPTSSISGSTRSLFFRWIWTRTTTDCQASGPFNRSLPGWTRKTGRLYIWALGPVGAGRRILGDGPGGLGTLSARDLA